jgi:hypothetical protein
MSFFNSLILLFYNKFDDAPGMEDLGIIIAYFTGNKGHSIVRCV